MTVRLQRIHESSRGPIHVVVAGYRSRPSDALIQSAGLRGSVYAVHWAAGKWAEAGTSVGVIARGMRVGVPALRTGKMMLGLGSIGACAGGALLLGAGQFRLRYGCAARDGKQLPALLADLPGIADRPVCLYGHSLGTVVIRSALETIDHDRYRIEDVVLMGGMASRLGWEPLADRFAGRLINLYSPLDRILSIAPVWDRVVGRGEVISEIVSESVSGTEPAPASGLIGRLLNHNLSDRLPSQFNAWAHHSGYWKHFGGFVDDGGL